MVLQCIHTCKVEEVFFCKIFVGKGSGLYFWEVTWCVRGWDVSTTAFYIIYYGDHKAWIPCTYIFFNFENALWI